MGTGHTFESLLDIGQHILNSSIQVSPSGQLKIFRPEGSKACPLYWSSRNGVQPMLKIVRGIFEAERIWNPNGQLHSMTAVFDNVAIRASRDMATEKLDSIDEYVLSAFQVYWNLAEARKVAIPPLIRSYLDTEDFVSPTTTEEEWSMESEMLDEAEV